MKNLLIKILLRLIEPQIESEKVDKKKLDQWLDELLLPKSGFVDWYTIRKKVILSAISTGKEGKEYWMYIGRLLELKQLAKKAEMQLNKEDKKKLNKRNKKKV